MMMSGASVYVRFGADGWSRASATPRTRGGAVNRQVAVGSAPTAAPTKTDPLDKLQVWAEESGISAPKLRIFQSKGGCHLLHRSSSRLKCALYRV